MAYELMVGLTVSNDQVYQEYREAMAPLLQEFGGGFRFDFKVAEVLRSEAPHPINRVFAIYFRNQEAKDSFFSHPDYKKIKESFFKSSVNGTTIISEYSRPS